MGTPTRILKSGPDRFYTLAEARDIRGPIIYGLHDGRKIFYVGRTLNPKDRFYRYAPAKTSPLALLRAIRDAGDQLRIVVLERDPADLDAAEKRFIGIFAEQLVNRAGSPLGMMAAVNKKMGTAILADQLAQCPKCGGDNYERGQHKCYFRSIPVLQPKAGAGAVKSMKRAPR